MVKCESSTRFSSIKNPIVLTQTDTTVGFLSQDAAKLYEIKSRPAAKPLIKVYANFKSLLEDSKRVAKKDKNIVRRLKKTTFIIKTNSFRVAKTPLKSQIFRDAHWFYSTSANRSGENYDREFCEAKADIIIEDVQGLSEKKSSTLIKLGRSKRRRLR
ncbi:MAG: hypothetical protein QG559_1207 [Campylobacterota bacterium]|nr:hypothetical protein [Campylobacterota bacterium]